MDIPTSDEARRWLADGLQAMADHATYFRLDSGPYVEVVLASTEPNWPVTRALIRIAMTDRSDGKDGRASTALRGYEISTGARERDPEADHKFLHGLFSGLRHRAMRNGDTRTARRLTRIVARNSARNERIDGHRARIHEYGLDEKELGASLINKVKMNALVAGCIALSSPLATSWFGRQASLALIAAGTRLGEYGERQFGKKVDGLIAAASRLATVTALSDHESRSGS